MKNIVLVGEYYSSNLGDNLLCQCAEQLIRNYLDDISISWVDLTYGSKPSFKKSQIFKIYDFFTSYIRNTNRGSLIYRYMAYNVYKRLRHIEKRRKIDLIIFAGGQMFLDYFSFQISRIIKYAEQNDIPVIFNSCGFGSFSSSAREQFINVLNSSVVKRITLRDGLSFIHNLTKKELFHVPDNAILCSEVFNVLKKDKSDIIGLGVISPFIYNANNVEKISEDDFITFWTKIISKIESEGLKWQLFVNGSEDDFLFANKILFNLNLAENPDLISPRPTSAMQLISIISSYKAIISCRLHSYIISYSLAIPAIMLNWDNKVIEFARMIHCESYVFQIKDFDFDNFINLLTISSNIIYNAEVRSYLHSLVRNNFMIYKQIL